MPIELHRTARLLHVPDVVDIISGTVGVAAYGTGTSVDMEELTEEIEKDRATHGSLPTKNDVKYARKLHTTLRDLPRRTLLDPCLWHWICLDPLRSYVLGRWCGGVEADAIGSVTRSAVEHFVGGASLVGFSRNAAARLFFGADASWDHVGDYSDVDAVFANTDLYTGIFERKFALSSTAAVLLSRRLMSEVEDLRRAVLRRLNFVLTTTSLEALSDDELLVLVEELVEEGA